MIVQGRVGAPTAANGTDGNAYDILQGKQLELIVSELMGKYYTQAVRKNVFHGSTTGTGVILPISTTTAPTFGLWNPLGSAKLAVLARFQVGYGATPIVAHSMYHSFQSNVGTQAATGSPITAFTSATPQNGYLGDSTASAMKFTATTATLAAAGTILKSAGFSQVATTGASTTVPGWQFIEDIDGMIIVPPGTIWYPTGTAAAGVAMAMSISWVEVPA